METYGIRFGMSTIPGDPTSYIILHPRNTRSGAASGLAYLPGELSELRMGSPEFLSLSFPDPAEVAAVIPLHQRLGAGEPYFGVKSLDKTKVTITISGVSDI
jgi:hypothetical protein